MDKVKVYLTWLKRNNFWVLCFILLATAIVCWNMATSQVEADVQKNTKQINDVSSRLRRLQKQQNPNERFIEGLKAEDKKIRDQALRVTELAYETQHKLLKWPLPAEVEAIGELKLSSKEEKENHPPGDPRVPEIPIGTREIYQNLVAQPEMKRIIEKVKIRRVKPADKGANPNANPNHRAPAAFTGIVTWPEDQWSTLLDRYRMDITPSTVRVYVTQEDFWVFEALIDVILYMNRDATDHLNAVVRGVQKLDVAQWATLAAQQEPGVDVMPVDADAAAGLPGGMGGPLGGGGASPPGMPGSEAEYVKIPGQKGAAGDENKLSPDDQLIDGRYVDGENKPVPAEAVKTTPPFNEFKQLPIVMRLQMDQRRVPDLLAALANSPEPKALPIEVRQVRMFFLDVDQKADAAGLGGNAIEQRADRGPYDCDVEIRGIVYLYNRPDASKLGLGSAATPAKREFGIPVPSSASVPMPPMNFDQPQ
ncbi:MAG: hypothetical protein JSS27_20950 [Planctomycetes bacterium]|nr:hypothetical protein [Planctomycetota bacterium]